MKLKHKKDMIFFITASLAMLAMIWFGLNNSIDFGINLTEATYPRGRVVEVISDQTEVDADGVRRGRQDLLVEILTGENRGRIVEVQNILFIDAAVYAQVGTRVVLFFDQQEGDTDYFARVHTYERATAIYVIIILFVGLLTAVSGKAGLRSAFGLIFTFVTLLFLLIPSIANGAPPALLTLGLSLCIIAVSLIAIMGFERKTHISIAGAAIGIVLCCFFYLIISLALRITGFNVPEMSILVNVGFQANARIAELLFSGIIIASLGAVMDTSVSVASATAEIAQADQKAEFMTLFRRSMSVARDCIGTSVNTLVLAFTGTFFVTLVLFQLNNFDYHMIIHRTDIAIEVLRAMTASAALVLCAPATALISARMYCAKQSKKK
jgi:uncharacterized membrane protein